MENLSLASLALVLVLGLAACNNQQAEVPVASKPAGEIQAVTVNPSPAVKTEPVETRVYRGTWDEFPDYPFTVTVTADGTATYADKFGGGCTFTVPIAAKDDALVTEQYDGCRSGGRTYNNIVLTIKPDGTIRWRSFEGNGNYETLGKLKAS